MSLSGSYRLGFELRGTTDKVTATVNDVLADTPAAGGRCPGGRPDPRDRRQAGRRRTRSARRSRHRDGAPLTLTVERGGKTVDLVPVAAGEVARSYGVVGVDRRSRSGSTGRRDDGRSARRSARLVHRRRQRRGLEPRRDRPGLVRGGRAGHGHLPLGARPDQPLARAPEPAAAAAARRRPHRLLARSRGSAAAPSRARSTSASRWSGSPSSCCSSSSASRTTSAGSASSARLRLAADGLPSAPDQRRRRRDRRRRAGRRPVDDADADARRRGDDRADRRARLRRLRGRPLRRPEDRGRRGARPDRPASARSR